MALSGAAHSESFTRMKVSLRDLALVMASRDYGLDGAAFGFAALWAYPVRHVADGGRFNHWSMPVVIYFASCLLKPHHGGLCSSLVIQKVH